MLIDFAQRSMEFERIDTGDYTEEEYDQFLIDIRRVNQLAGDIWALKKTLHSDIKNKDLREFSVLDLGAGSGELLRSCAKFARKTNRKAHLYGLELNRRSAESILQESEDFEEISSIQADVLNLPFKENSFDYVICSLFTHHFNAEDIKTILEKMAAISRRKIFVIDLHRHRAAYGMYKIFTSIFIKGSLVKEDGALSILRGFKPAEMENLALEARLRNFKVERCFPFRIVLTADI